MGEPKLLAIDHDDYHASHIGQLSDGRQLFLTTPFVPAGNYMAFFEPWGSGEYDT